MPNSEKNELRKQKAARLIVVLRKLTLQDKSTYDTDRILTVDSWFAILEFIFNITSACTCNFGKDDFVYI